MCGAGPAVARQPDALTIDAAVQLAAVTVLLHEGSRAANSSGMPSDHLIRPRQERRRAY
jgi:hypothetical protein